MAVRFKRNALILSCIIVAGMLIYTLYPGQRIPQGIVIDKIAVWKSQRKLRAFSGNRLIITYTVALGKVPVGPKQYEGDNKTPEGRYFIFDKTEHSRYHKNLGISYPNDTDKINALKLDKPAGRDIKIHGLQNGIGFIGRLHTMRDWTAGCIAITNQEIDDLYEHISIGATVDIMP